MLRAYRMVARGLTLGRFAATPPFLFVLAGTPEEPGQERLAALTLAYLAIALSDLLDGVFARVARASSHRWAQLDAIADILFNTSSLLVASWLGLVGVWVPLGIIVLATVFMHRNRRVPITGHVRLSEDRLGRAAGVVYYLLVGAVVSSLWFGKDTTPQIAVWWLGNIVFVYTMTVLIRNLTVGAVSGR